MGVLGALNELSGAEAASRVGYFIDVTVYDVSGTAIEASYTFGLPPQANSSEYPDTQSKVGLLQHPQLSVSDKLRMAVFADFPNTVHYVPGESVFRGQREFAKKLRHYARQAGERKLGGLMMAHTSFLAQYENSYRDI